jgi:hypothetical protein
MCNVPIHHLGSREGLVTDRRSKGSRKGSQVLLSDDQPHISPQNDVHAQVAINCVYRSVLRILFYNRDRVILKCIKCALYFCIKYNVALDRVARV